MPTKPLSYTVLELQKIHIEMLLERLDRQYALLEEKGVDPTDVLARVTALGDVATASRQLQTESPKRLAFFRYIDSLDEATAKKLTALMYLGRGDADTFDDMYETTVGWTLQSCQHSLGDKTARLHEYLFEGQMKLRQEGTEIDKI